MSEMGCDRQNESIKDLVNALFSQSPSQTDSTNIKDLASSLFYHSKAKQKVAKDGKSQQLNIFDDKLID